MAKDTPQAPTSTLMASDNAIDIFDQLADVALLVGPRWEVLRLNPAAAAWLQVAPPAGPGLSLWIAAAGLADSPAEAPLREAMTRRAATTFEYVRPGETSRLEFRASPCGEGLLLLGRDVTQRHQAYERLLVDQRWHKKLVDNAPAIISRFDRQFRHLFVSEELGRMAGLKPEDFLGKSIRDLGMPASLCDLWEAKTAEAFSGTGVVELFFEYPSDVGMRAFQARLVPETGPDGTTIESVMSIVAEVTDLRHAQEELRRLNETLERRVEVRTAEAVKRAAMLRALAGELLRAEERERARVSRVLHDGLQQMLVSAKFQLRTVLESKPVSERPEGLVMALETMDRAITASRSLAAELSPPLLRREGLPAALRWLAGEVAKRHALEVAVTTDSAASPADPELRDFMFHAARELLFNVVKHARPLRASLDLAINPAGEYVVTVKDYGPGFDPTVLDVGESADGMGLPSIRERAELLGGRLEIDSAPARGSSLTLILPGPASPSPKA